MEEGKVKSESYREKCFRRANINSDKISRLIRFVVFAGFGLIWVILQAYDKNMEDLSRIRSLGLAVIFLCSTVIAEFFHLIMDVSSNLYQGYYNVKFSKRKLKRIFTMQWILWYVKAILVIVAYVCILIGMLQISYSQDTTN